VRRSPIETFWLVLGGFGALRLFLLLAVFGVLYLAWGNTAGRLIGLVLLAALAVWIWKLVRSSRDHKGV